MTDAELEAFEAYLDADDSDLDPSEGYGLQGYDPEAQADLELHNFYHPDSYHG
jgi:hypothetical protein